MVYRRLQRSGRRSGSNPRPIQRHPGHLVRAGRRPLPGNRLPPGHGRVVVRFRQFCHLHRFTPDIQHHNAAPALQPFQPKGRSVSGDFAVRPHVSRRLRGCGHAGRRSRLDCVSASGSEPFSVRPPPYFFIFPLGVSVDQHNPSFFLTAVPDGSNLTAAAEEWAKESWDLWLAGQPTQKEATYVNYATGKSFETLESIYGHEPWRLEKLRRLKARYDPFNRFGYYVPIVSS